MVIKGVIYLNREPLLGLRVSGKVWGCSDFENGCVITTSRVVDVINMTTIETSSGSFYKYVIVPADQLNN
jgi:hypothetical protein